MYKSESHRLASMEAFKLDGRMMRYSLFIPKLYNLCKSMGFQAGKILPSRAFCSDESQDFPIILMAKHFGTFPFNHGQVGGIIATDRHGPFAEHGEDLIIIQASHVGYDPASNTFGVYRRLQTETQSVSPNCGKIENVLGWYQSEYAFARENVFVERRDEDWWVTIDNQLLNDDREEGIFLKFENLVALDEHNHLTPEGVLSTSRCFRASAVLRERLDDAQGERCQIGALLTPECFYFKRKVDSLEEGRSHLEQNLLPAMSWIVGAQRPMLAAAKVNTQVEYDRAFRTIMKSPAYRGKRVFYIAGLNIDISPQPGQIFPLTKFVPWAAYIQQADGSRVKLEQDEIFEKLYAQSAENPDQIELEDAIRAMTQASEVTIPMGN